MINHFSALVSFVLTRACEYRLIRPSLFLFKIKLIFDEIQNWWTQARDTRRSSAFWNRNFRSSFDQTRNRQGFQLSATYRNFSIVKSLAAGNVHQTRFKLESRHYIWKDFIAIRISELLRSCLPTEISSKKIPATMKPLITMVT